MELESPSQRNCPVQLTPQTFEMFELGKITLVLGQTNIIFQQLFVKLTGKQTS